jgi:hypothetical protein
VNIGEAGGAIAEDDSAILTDEDYKAVLALAMVRTANAWVGGGGGGSVREGEEGGVFSPPMRIGCTARRVLWSGRTFEHARNPQLVRKRTKRFLF